jgi:hypothetical protein
MKSPLSRVAALAAVADFAQAGLSTAPARSVTERDCPSNPSIPVKRRKAGASAAISPATDAVFIS